MDNEVFWNSVEILLLKTDELLILRGREIRININHVVIYSFRVLYMTLSYINCITHFRIIRLKNKVCSIPWNQMKSFI